MRPSWFFRSNWRKPRFLGESRARDRFKNKLFGVPFKAFPFYRRSVYSVFWNSIYLEFSIIIMDIFQWWKNHKYWKFKISKYPIIASRSKMGNLWDHPITAKKSTVLDLYFHLRIDFYDRSMQITKISSSQNRPFSNF